MTKPIAFMPLSTYPEAVSDGAISAALHFGASLGCAVHVAAFAADVPQLYAPMGDVAFDMSALIEGAKKASAAEAARLEALTKTALPDRSFVYRAHSGGMYQAIPAEARLYDLVLMPWQKGAATLQDMAEAAIFAAGRPVVLVPEGAKPAALDHLAIAWNASAVAARALNDALPLLAKGGRITVLYAGAEGGAADQANLLSAALLARGFTAGVRAVDTHGAPIADALQAAAVAAGAQMMAMGGFGHSRLRDFVLGGATKGVLMQLGLPVLLSH